MLLTMARDDIVLESAPYEAEYVMCTMFTLGKCGRLLCSAAEVLYVAAKTGKMSLGKDDNHTSGTGRGRYWITAYQAEVDIGMARSIDIIPLFTRLGDEQWSSSRKSFTMLYYEESLPQHRMSCHRHPQPLQDVSSRILVHVYGYSCSTSTVPTQYELETAHY